MKILPIKKGAIHFKVKHPLIQESLRFETWISLCDFAMEVAEREAEKQLNEQIMSLIFKISDEIIDTAYECEKNE